MSYNNERHKELVRNYLEVMNQERVHEYNGSKEHLELLEYNILVEKQVFWTHYEEFLHIMKNFLDNISNFDEFETAFTLLFDKTLDEVTMINRDVEKIEKFQPRTLEVDWFSGSIIYIFRQFEAVDDEYITKQELKDCVEKTYLEIRSVL